MRRILTIILALSLLAAPGVAHADSKVVPSSPVVITGSFGANAVLTLLYPQDDPGVTAVFEWFADGTKISGAQGPTLSLAPELVGQTVSARVTLRKTGFSDHVVDIPGAKVFSSLPISSGRMGWHDESVEQPGCFAPRANGVSTPTIGWSLWFSCQPFNTSFGSQVVQKFWWYRNGQLIEGANQSTYRLQTADAGQAIWGAYQVTYANGFVFFESKRLGSSVPFQITLAKPTISGSLRVGDLLQASTTGSDPQATLTYQWFSDYALVPGATSASYVVKQEDLAKAVQVLVVAQREGHSPSSALSDPVQDSRLTPANPMAAYSKVFNGYTPTNTAYDIQYVTSPSVSPETLAREKLLVQRAADFWSPDYSPVGVTIVYLTKDDASWAEELIRQNPSWSNSIPGGIRSWIERNSCGFALAFQVEQRKIFIQCLRNGAESSLNDQQVGPHEYSHWVQYEQTPSLFLGTVPWLIEGQANFYGLALGIAPQDPTLKFINTSLAGHATQYDIYNGYRFGDFKVLDLFQSGNVFDIQTMLTRSGTVWDSYTIGTLASEWLVARYGHQKYVEWMKQLLQTKGQNNESERAANSIAFERVFGFEYSQLGLHLTPYIAARAGQLRTAWNDTYRSETTSPTVNPTQSPSVNPTQSPTVNPTQSPTVNPTQSPSVNPTQSPTVNPTQSPSVIPTQSPSVNPTQSPTVNMTQQLPTFAGKTSALNASHRGWISGKVKAGPIQQVICTAIYSSKTNAKDVAIYKLRAQNSCQFAKTVLLGIGKTSKTSVTMSKSTKSAEVGKVYMSFKR
jgi:hypothetical protein